MLFLAAFAANFLIEFTIMIPRGGFAAAFDRFPGKTRGYGSWTSLCRLFTDFLVEFSAVFFAVASPPRRPASSRVIFRLLLVAITNHSFTVVFAMRICYLPRLICHESKHSD